MWASVYAYIRAGQLGLRFCSVDSSVTSRPFSLYKIIYLWAKSIKPTSGQIHIIENAEMKWRLDFFIINFSKKNHKCPTMVCVLVCVCVFTYQRVSAWMWRLLYIYLCTILYTSCILPSTCNSFRMAQSVPRSSKDLNCLFLFIYMCSRVCVFTYRPTVHTYI